MHQASCVPTCLLVALAEALIITAIVMVSHCYYGYAAGVRRVSRPSARSMRFSLVSVQVVVLFATLALYVDPNFNLSVAD